MDKTIEIDNLNEMFDLQKTFQKRLHGHIIEHHLDCPLRIPIQVTAIIAELGEILEEYQLWKDWRYDYPKVDREHLLEEVADLWHFVINLTLYLGFDANDVYFKFLEKNKENHNRQDRGY